MSALHLFDPVRWLMLGVFAWPMHALAPDLDHAVLWTEVFSASGEDLQPDAMTVAPRGIVQWIAFTGDNEGMPFLVLDKHAAQLYVYDARGELFGTTPVLLGAARGDESVPGIGERLLALVRPEEKTTPAGRFVAESGRNLNGEDIYWVDYDAAVSLHRVRATNPRERRLERLATPTARDNRISFGCINVPAGFYDDVVQRALAGGRGFVYVLPETRPAFTVFGIGPSLNYKL